MSDIFLSYSRDDLARARRLAEALAAEGWSVWFDPHIRSGALFDRAIEKALAEARCVIVLWSKTSVESDWVRAEAGDGLDRGILVPVAIEEGVRIPLRFRHVQTAELSRWGGSRTDPRYERLVGDVRHLLEASVPATPRSGEGAPEPTGAAAAEPPVPPRQGWEIVEQPPRSIPAPRSRALSERFGPAMITALMLLMFGLVAVAVWVDLTSSSSTTGSDGTAPEITPPDNTPERIVLQLSGPDRVARAREMVGRNVEYVPGEGAADPLEPLGTKSDDLGFVAWVIGISREFTPGTKKLEYNTFENRDLFQEISHSNVQAGDLYLSPSKMGIVTESDGGWPSRVILCSKENYQETGDCVREVDVFVPDSSSSFWLRPDYAELFRMGNRTP